MLEIQKLFKTLISYWKSIVIITTFFAIFSVFYALNLNNIYKSSAVLKPSNIDAGLGALSNQSNFSLGSLTSGLNPFSQNSNASFAIELIKSRELFKTLVLHDGVLESIYAPYFYDPETGELFFDPDLFDANNKKWVREAPKNFESKPSYLEIYQTHYLEAIEVNYDRRSEFIYLSYKHISPIFASRFLNLIIKEVNALSQKKIIEKSNSTISFLKSELSKTIQIDVQNTINRMIGYELNKLAVVNSSNESTLELIDPPFIPEVKDAPRRSIICIIITLVGFILSISRAILIELYISARSKSQ